VIEFGAVVTERLAELTVEKVQVSIVDHGGGRNTGIRPRPPLVAGVGVDRVQGPLGHIAVPVLVRLAGDVHRSVHDGHRVLNAPQWNHPPLPAGVDVDGVYPVPGTGVDRPIGHGGCGPDHSSERGGPPGTAVVDIERVEIAVAADVDRLVPDHR